MSDELTAGSILDKLVQDLLQEVRVGLKSVETEVAAVKTQQMEHTRVLNGVLDRQKLACEAIEEHLGEHAERDKADARLQGRAEGRREQREDDVEKVKTLTDYVPIIIGALLGIAGGISFLFGKVF